MHVLTAEDLLPPIMTLEECAGMLRVEPKWLQLSACPRIKPSHAIARYDRDQSLAWFRAFSTDSEAA